MRKFISPGGVVLDVGANIGFFSNFFSGVVGASGQVHSFEPDKINFHHLQNELKNCNNVTLIQKAVAESSGTLMLYTSDLLNVDHRTYEPENYKDKYSVEKISIDDYVAGKFNVDFIKMDIQGFELDALRGMSITLKENPDIILFIEFWPYGLQKAGSSATELFDFITALGYNIFNADADEMILMNRKNAVEMKIEYFTDSNVILSRRDLLLNL